LLKASTSDALVMAGIAATNAKIATTAKLNPPLIIRR
jgi:hypothetical protein